MMADFSIGKTASFKTIGGPIGSEFNGVMINAVNIDYTLAIMMDPTLHTTNNEVYSYNNEDPIDLKDKSFIVFTYNNERIVFCRDWVIADSIEVTDMLSTVTYVVDDVIATEKDVIKDIIQRMGYKVRIV
jgi:hypothetical protein